MLGLSQKKETSHFQIEKMPFDELQLLGHDLPGIGSTGNNSWHPLEYAAISEIRGYRGTWSDRASQMQQYITGARDRASVFQQQQMQQPGFGGGPAWDYYLQHSATQIPQRDYLEGVNFRRQVYRFNERYLSNAGQRPAWESPYYIGPSMRGCDYFGRRW